MLLGITLRLLCYLEGKRIRMKNLTRLSTVHDAACLKAESRMICYQTVLPHYYYCPPSREIFRWWTTAIAHIPLAHHCIELAPLISRACSIPEMAGFRVCESALHHTLIYEEEDYLKDGLVCYTLFILWTGWGITKIVDQSLILYRPLFIWNTLLTSLCFCKESRLLNKV